MRPHHPHALNASVILMGISFFLAAMPRHTHVSKQIPGGEIARFAGLFLMGSTAFALLSPRKGVAAGGWS